MSLPVAIVVVTGTASAGGPPPRAFVAPMALGAAGFSGIAPCSEQATAAQSESATAKVRIFVIEVEPPREWTAETAVSTLFSL
jgi:hypothetical protein